MLAVMVPDLNGFREIGVCAEIRRAYGLESPQHIEIGVGICPQAVKLIVVHEKVNGFVRRVLAAFRIVKADPALRRGRNFG